MPVLFINCQSRPHAKLFGESAFFDLYTTGPQASKVVNLPVGSLCVVAEYHSEPLQRVIFNWYRFERERIQHDQKEAVDFRVFHGTWERAEILPKSVAAKHDTYGACFDKLGRFKQISVVAEV